MKYRVWFSLLVVTTLALVGCAVEPDTGEAASAAVTDNAMVPNAMVPNAMVPNAMVPNAMVPNALAPGSLDAASLASLQDPGQGGDLSRMFLKYLVGCALDATQSFSFSWTDATSVVHNETYPGVLGLAPSWATQPLTDGTRQRLITGCMAGRTNYFGTTVIISMRAPQNPLKQNVTASEAAAYPHVEGAFWGNIFAPTPYAYSCYNTANAAIARADARDCATGYLDDADEALPCGPIALAGPCEVVCPNLGMSGRAYTSCSDPPGSGTTTTVVVTTALP